MAVLLCNCLSKASNNTISPPELRTKENVTYIVAGVVIQDGKVLLIQEAKFSCRGAWYLPAGRMEKNETIVVSMIQ